MKYNFSTMLTARQQEKRLIVLESKWWKKQNKVKTSILVTPIFPALLFKNPIPEINFRPPCERHTQLGDKSQLRWRMLKKNTPPSLTHREEEEGGKNQQTNKNNRWHRLLSAFHTAVSLIMSFNPAVRRLCARLPKLSKSRAPVWYLITIKLLTSKLICCKSQQFLWRFSCSSAKAPCLFLL